MSSIKKTSTVIISAIIVTGITFGITDQFNSDDSTILTQIEFNAVYLESDGVVQISFIDKSKIRFKNNFYFSLMLVSTSYLTYISIVLMPAFYL